MDQPEATIHRELAGQPKAVDNFDKRPANDYEVQTLSGHVPRSIKRRVAQFLDGLGFEDRYVADYRLKLILKNRLGEVDVVFDAQTREIIGVASYFRPGGFERIGTIREIWAGLWTWRLKSWWKWSADARFQQTRQNMALHKRERDLLSTDSAGNQVARPHWSLEMLAVPRERRGTGIGTMLLQRGLKRAERDRIPLFVQSRHDVSEFYKKCGFTELSRFLVYRESYATDGSRIPVAAVLNLAKGNWWATQAQRPPALADIARSRALSIAERFRIRVVARGQKTR
jgi:GNAT superfamily N-acetyltransferase